MRKIVFLAALGVLAVSGVASAQQPAPQPATVQPTYAPGTVAATPVQPTAGATVIQGSGGCTNCGSTRSSGASGCGGFTMSNVLGGKCLNGGGCQNGCGSLNSVLAFQFGTCSQFFSPCGPTCGGLWKKKCPTTQFVQPFGTGYQCPRTYDTHANH